MASLRRPLGGVYNSQIYAQHLPIFRDAAEGPALHFNSARYSMVHGHCPQVILLENTVREQSPYPAAKPRYRYIADRMQ